MSTPVSYTAFDPANLTARDRYKLLVGGIVPRPIAWVSTISTTGLDNLAPFSFFCGAGSDPMSLIFCPANDMNGNEKDTLRNCKPNAEGGTGQFVVNIVDYAHAHVMSVTAEGLPPDDSEFTYASLETAPSTRVAPCRVRSSPIAYECETIQVIRTNPHAPGGGNVVLGRVLMVHVREDLHDDEFHIDPAKLDAIGRMAGLGYCSTRERFDVPFGKNALLDK